MTNSIGDVREKRLEGDLSLCVNIKNWLSSHVVSPLGGICLEETTMYVSSDTSKAFTESILLFFFISQSICATLFLH